MSYGHLQHNLTKEKKSMITNGFTICKKSVELNIMLEAQPIDDNTKNYCIFIMKYWFENINFKASVRDNVR